MIRNRPRENFTMVRNNFVRDVTLSRKAKALLLEMLSFPDNWTYYMSHLEKLSTDGQHATRAAMNELIKATYVVRERVRDESGKFQGYVYYVADYRQEEQEPEEPGTNKPKPSKSKSRKTTHGQAKTTKKEGSKIEFTKIKNINTIDLEPTQSVGNPTPKSSEAEDGDPRKDKSENQRLDPTKVLALKDFDTSTTSNPQEDSESSTNYSAAPEKSIPRVDRKPTKQEEWDFALGGKPYEDPRKQNQALRERFPRTHDALLSLKRHTSSKKGKTFTAETFAIWLDILLKDGVLIGDEQMQEWILTCIANDVSSPVSYYRKISDSYKESLNRPTPKAAEEFTEQFEPDQRVVVADLDKVYYYDHYLPSSSTAILEAVDGSGVVEVPIHKVSALNAER